MLRDEAALGHNFHAQDRASAKGELRLKAHLAPTAARLKNNGVGTQAAVISPPVSRLNDGFS
jgi:hypothetical protein